uniref:Uncharacterized protein MANES_11G057800 n=1 Tax=Rhizophora mucronata TaxID=61149 RepID=A0A2P2M3X3_RHIMU
MPFQVLSIKRVQCSTKLFNFLFLTLQFLKNISYVLCLH